MERLHGPALPYARAMVGARTVHEWAHLAVDAGLGAADRRRATSIARCAPRWRAELDAAIAAAPAGVRRADGRDLAGARRATGRRRRRAGAAHG